MIEWETNESHILINPTYSDASRQQFNQILAQNQDWPGHIWLATSGSTVKKWVGLSKQAILASAQAVNEHLQSGAFDRWALALPEFHVGGMGIRARSFLSGAKVFDFRLFNPQLKWNPHLFYDFLNQTQSTLTALVPSQIFDLVQLDLPAPPNLRALICGGGQLLPHLLEQAIVKGWNILPSYGLTECCSQVATAISSQNPELKILPHIKVRIKDARLAFSGSSLLSVYAYFEENQLKFVDPKQDGWFVSMDCGLVQNGYLSFQGRVDDYVKIGGENVDVTRLNTLLQSVKNQYTFSQCMLLIPVPHERLGYALHLVIEGNRSELIEEQILAKFHEKVLPFERVRQVNWVDEIPRSDLLKVLRQDLFKKIRS